MEYDRRHGNDGRKKEEGIISRQERLRREAQMTGYSQPDNTPLDVLEKDDARIFEIIAGNSQELEQQNTEQEQEQKQHESETERQLKLLTPDIEKYLNNALQAGIPAPLLGTYGTTVGTKVIWKTFGDVIAKHHGAKAATALGLTVGDGIFPIGDAIAAGLLISTTWVIVARWDKLWAEAEQILVQQEPEAQTYTIPTDEQVDTPRTTGHENPEVETEIPGYESPELGIPNNTGGQTTEQPDAEDFIMEAQVDQDFNDPEVRRRDDIAHGGYYTRKNLRKLVQEGTVSNHGNKHTTARTEEEARQFSHREAQYLPGINNGALEKEALLNGEHLLRRKGGGFWNFYRFDDYVGYDKGIKTRWIRAEYMSETIHGHPMNLKRLSKYVKNPTP